MDKNMDRRVRKTRRDIHDALISLMRTTPYSRIRVSQIAEMADISRSTFYLHYETKDDLLLSVMDEVIDQYFKAVDDGVSEDGPGPSLVLFSLWKQNLEKMKLILDAGMEYRIFERLREFNLKRERNRGEHYSLLDDYISTMLDGASFALLIRWTQDEASIPVEQMQTLFEGLEINALFERLHKRLPDFRVE